MILTNNTLSKTTLSSSSSSTNSNSGSDSDNTKDNFFDQDGGLRQSSRVRRPTRAVQSQLSQDAAVQREKEQKKQRKSKGKQKRGEKAKNTSQLMEDYCIDSK